jgi:hypothetical protein
MATAQQRTPREVGEFPPNTPVSLSLKYAQGKHLDGTYGERVMYTTTDNRVVFLDVTRVQGRKQLSRNRPGPQNSSEK